MLSPKPNDLKTFKRNGLSLGLQKECCCPHLTFLKSLQEAIILWNNYLRSMYADETGGKRNTLPLKRNMYTRPWFQKRFVHIFWKLKALIQAKKKKKWLLFPLESNNFLFLIFPTLPPRPLCPQWP